MRVRTPVAADGDLVVLAHPVAVIDSSARQRSSLVSNLRQIASSYTTVEAFDEAIEPGDPMVIVLGPSVSRRGDLDEVERLLRTRPEVRAIMVTESLSTELLQHAIRAGVTDVVLHGAVAEELYDAVVRADRQLTVQHDGGAIAPTGGNRDGRITTIFSPKGGSGKSVVATNLAVALAKSGPGPVVLVDGDLQFGDVAVMLHLAPKHTIVDAVDAIDRLDVHMLRSLLVPHEASGVLVLAAPTEPAMADQVTASDMGAILEVLRSFASHVVVDTSSAFNDVIMAVLEHSDDIIVVGGMDIPTIKDVKVGLQTLRLLDVPVERLRLVLNRANSKVKVEIQEVERTLQLRAETLIPSDILVPTTVNRGVPAVLDVPRSGVARSIMTLAQSIIGAEAKGAA